MDSNNHYEVAFASYLLAQRLCYVAVDESRRSLANEMPIKSLDFLVFGPEGVRLVVDVKGRRFPGGPPSRPRRVWECWSFRDDIDGLERWADLAGPDYRGLLVFAYLLHPSIELAADTPDLFAFRGKRYLFRAIDVSDYREHMRVRSPSWQTVTLPREAFRALVRPMRDFLRPCATSSEVPF
jgi:hypothetical protein